MALGYAWFDSYDSVGYVLALHISPPYSLPIQAYVIGSLDKSFGGRGRVVRVRKAEKTSQSSLLGTLDVVVVRPDQPARRMLE